MADSGEARFQQDIIEAMARDGWKTGTASGYYRANALYTEDLLAYVQEAWPERWEEFCKANLQTPEQVSVQKVVREQSAPVPWRYCATASRCRSWSTAASSLTMA